MKTLPSMAAAVLLAAGLAEGRSLQSRPVLLRLEGHVGETRDGDRKVAELTMRRGSSTITFQLNEIWVLSGDVASGDILSEVEPYNPSMSLAGPASVVDELGKASPDQLLQVDGYFRRGQRIFMLSAVEPAKAKR